MTRAKTCPILADKCPPARGNDVKPPATAGGTDNLLLLRLFLQPSHIPFDPAFGFVVIGKFLLVAFEGGGVVVAAAVDVFGRVGDVEHFVKDDVFDDVSGNVTRIERPADRDVIVCRVVMAEDAIGFFRGPGEDGFWDRVAKILACSATSNISIEIVDRTL